MNDNSEHLEAIFLKDNLDKTDVVNLLAGHRIKLNRGYGDSSAHNLVTGKKLGKNEAKKIIERWHSVKEIWESSTHSRSNIQLQMDSTHEDLMASRNYVIRWANEKATGSNKLFEGFRECIEYALEQQWITPKDWELVEEAPKEPEPMKEKTESPKELENRVRLIGVLADMLQDKNVSKESTETATSIAKHVADNYGTDMPNKGLAEDTVTKVLTAAKKLLKDDGIK